jgi:RHS repeat-associated protein
MAAFPLKPLLPAARLAEARQRFTVATAGLALLSGFAVAGMELPFLASLPQIQEYGDLADGTDGEVLPREGNDLAAEAPVEAAWPEADSAVLDLSGGTAETTLGGLPVIVSKIDTSSPDTVEIGVLPPDEADAAGISGLLLAVAADGGEVEVEVDYATMAGYYGGAYGSRLAAWDLPGCAAGTGKGCAADAVALDAVNDTETQTVTFTVDTSRGDQGGSTVASAGGHGMLAASNSSTAQSDTTTTVTALAATESSEQGDYTATALAPSSEWSHGGSSGAFNWSYGIEVPPVIGDLAPDITLSYSSQTSDGRTAVTNNQGSWIGEGFTYEPGYIERSYQSCADDGHKDQTGAGDQCWAWDNASIVLAGASGDLVKDGDTWRISGDDGSKVERLTGAANGDDNGEYWKVTTVDGTQYFFGRHQLPGYESTDTATSSTWTVPVFGDDSGEPCYNATFANAYCDQAWRWNLDFVVDPTGNAMSYYYARETNYYARHGDTTVNGDNYHRGGYLKSIQYGLRSTDAYTTAPARVTFTVAERCLAYDTSIDCSPSALTDATAANWPDVPWDRNCAVSTKCEASQTSPTFWTRKRLTAITTQIWDGVAYQSVDAWALAHSYVSNGDTTRSLWLDSITRTGKAGTSADIKLPATTLLPVQKENRIDKTGDNIAALIRPRLGTIYTDTGSQIDVAYAGADCTPTDTPTPDSNERRCFPVIWQPGSYDDDITDWFHKYVVSGIAVSDRTGASPTQNTTYTYANPAWRKTQYQGIGDETTLTWADWRGYGTVTTTGAPSTTLETKTVTKYYQGMHGDKTSSGSTRTVTLTDALGYTHTDYDQLSGSVLDQLTYNDGQIVAKTSNSYWRHVSATDSHSWGDLEAAFVRSNTTRTDTLKADGTWRRTSTDSDWDTTYGLVTTVDDFGDGATSADNRCTTYEYARNTSAYLIDYSKRIETVAVDCAKTPDRATQVIADLRNLFDAGAYSAAPTSGLVTAVQELAFHDGTNANYVTTAATTYDDYGRPLTATDANGNTSTNTYTDAGGRNIGQTVTNVLGHTATTTYDISRHLETAVTDANAQTTRVVHDPLGRTAQVWMPFQDPAASGALPYLRFSYTVSDTAPTAVTTEQLEEDRTSYTKSIAIYDGQLRTRQTQATSTAGNRLITDTLYDPLGRVSESRDVYAALGEPIGTLLLVDSGETDMATVTEYDDLGRATATVTAEAGVELWRSASAYWVDKSTTTAPDGGTATSTFTDARGNTTALWQYLDNEPVGEPQKTQYTYTSAGNLASVTDFDNNIWSFTYDQRGRKIRSSDPDTGTSTFTYDPVGNLITTTDNRGQTITSVYDQLNRVTATWDGPASTTAGGVRLTRRVWDTLYIGYETGSVSYEDNMTIGNWIDTRNWDYQPVGQRTVISGTAAGSLAGTYEYGTDYYIDGTTKGRTWSAFGGLDAEGVAYVRDQLGRITTVYGQDGTYSNNLAYDPVGKLISAQYPTDKTVLGQYYTYGKANRLARTWSAADDRNGTLTDITYDYDDAGNVLSVIDNPNAQNTRRQAECYTYDGLRRLTEAWSTRATGTDGSACTGGAATTGIAGAAAYWQSYTFDAAGNRTSLTVHNTAETGTNQTWNYTYDTPDQETAHSLETVAKAGASESTSFEYDQAGNTTAVTSTTGFAQDITWDATGRVETITTTGAALSSTGAVSGDVADGPIEFFYNADGGRSMRSTTTETTLYVAGVEITLDKNTGTLASTRTVDLPGGASRTEKAGGTAQLQLVDHHGTGILAFDCYSADITRRYSDPYGNKLNTITTAADGNPVWLGQGGYVKGTIDPTGYTHIGARDYNPTTGRFLSVDPIGDMTNGQHLNGYAYSYNNPKSFADPTGLTPGSVNGMSCIDGDCSYHNGDGSLRSKSDCDATKTCGRGKGSGIGGVTRATRPKVSNSSLQNILNNMYRETSTVGDGSTAAAIAYELQSGKQVNKKWHISAGASYASSLSDLLEKHRISLAQGGGGILSEADYEIAYSEFKKLYNAINMDDVTGNVTEALKTGKPETKSQFMTDMENITRRFSVADVTGTEFKINQYNGRPKHIEGTTGRSLGMVARGLGVLSAAPFVIDLAQSGLQGAVDQYAADTLCGYSFVSCTAVNQYGEPMNDYDGDGVYTQSYT